MTGSDRRSTGDPAAYCGSCGHLEHPSDGGGGACDRCGADELIRIDGVGTVYTCTVVHVGTPGVETPYALAYVDFEPGARAFGRLAVADAEIGRRVVPVFKPEGLFFERFREEGDS
ncbi:MAG: Zn-ribbon domain-containing OB-fold protein [Thermoleophilia bacterium]